MSFLALAGSALTLGFVHGLGADHLMAIAVLSVDRRGRRTTPAAILGTAVRFASGHALLLGVGASLAVLFGWVVPAAVESGAETLGGVLLVVLGAAGIWHVVVGRAYGHVHADRRGRARWHFHLGGRHADDTHPSSLATLLGAVFAVSSLRMLMLLVPFGEAAGALAVPALLAVIVLFGLGILLSMSLFGVLLARAFSLRIVDRLGRAAAALVALASVALGVIWIA